MEINFETTSEPFGEGSDANDDAMFKEEVERILHKIARQVQNGSTEATVYDLNGARVGTWAL